MFKMTRLMSMLLILFISTACNKGSGDAQQSAQGRSRAVAGPINPMTPPPPTTIAGGTISGTITVESSLTSKLAETDVIYITARSVERPTPPLAVKQLRNVRFPYQYTLSSADLMQGGSFQGKVNIVVRVDRDGVAGPPQPGDMEGVFAGNPATVGDQRVDIVINKMY